MSVKPQKTPETPEASAFRLLGRRDYSREEMCRKLTGKGFSSGETDRVIGKLESLGLLDDRKLARRMAGYYSREKLWGPRKVFQKLAQRGIPADLIREEIEGREENGKTAERLRKVLNQRMKGQDLHCLGPQEKRRLAGYLRQKGYAWEDIREALQESGGSVEE